MVHVLVLSDLAFGACPFLYIIIIPNNSYNVKPFLKDLHAHGYLNWGCANRLDIRLSFPYLVNILYKIFFDFARGNND